ncbi:MAG TPA: transcriptional regulator [Spirochaetia bacterium]|nr:transcriptional regulator [Spirochaetia bacterium]
MADLYLKFDSVFFEKTRLSILTLLYREGRLSFNALKEALAATDGAVYTHLEKLKQAGYVTRDKELVDGSVSSQYELTDLGRTEFRAYIGFLEGVLKEHSDSSQ